MKPVTTASPHAIIMIGIPGAGKSAFATQFAETFKALLLDRTKYQREFGLSDEQAESLSHAILTEYFKTNRTLVVEGDLDTKEKRDALAKKLTKAGYKLLLVWVQTDTAEAFRRATKPFPVGSGMDEVQFEELVDAFEAPTAKEKAVVISGKHTYATQLKIVLKQLALKAGYGKNTPPKGTSESGSSARIAVRR